MSLFGLIEGAAKVVGAAATVVAVESGKDSGRII
jgi:hypothetical protein